MSAANRPYLMTVAEFLAWDAPDASDRWELIDGEPVAMAPARPRHGMIAAETGRVLGNHLAAHPRCRVVTDAGVKPDDYNFRIPDLAITCERLGLDALLLAEPILIIEILSPSNARDTRAAVVGYMTIPSVREILVLHSDEVGAELLRREMAGTWARATLAAGDAVSLMSIGFEAPLADFYRTARVGDSA
jgi:Uma2 family endonuclease